MNLFETMERFPTHESCIEYLESIRFKVGAFYPPYLKINNPKTIQSKILSISV